MGRSTFSQSVSSGAVQRRLVDGNACIGHLPVDYLELDIVWIYDWFLYLWSYLEKNILHNVYDWHIFLRTIRPISYTICELAFENLKRFFKRWRPVKWSWEILILQIYWKPFRGAYYIKTYCKATPRNVTSTIQCRRDKVNCIWSEWIFVW